MLDVWRAPLTGFRLPGDSTRTEAGWASAPSYMSVERRLGGHSENQDGSHADGGRLEAQAANPTATARRLSVRCVHGALLLSGSCVGPAGAPGEGEEPNKGPSGGPAGSGFRGTPGYDFQSSSEGMGRGFVPPPGPTRICCSRYDPTRICLIAPLEGAGWCGEAW
jgi:hypothetical protein